MLCCQRACAKLIVLNGTSSSGKTSIARVLQARWPTPLLYLALDTAIGMMPSAYIGNGAHAIDGYRLDTGDQHGKPFATYSIGRHAIFLNNNLASTAASLCSAGYDVVLDHIITDDITMIGLAERVDCHSAFLIGVCCDREVAEMREELRGDRSIGLVAGQATSVHSGLRPYDSTVDSSLSSPVELAEAISVFVNGASPTGFSQIMAAHRRSYPTSGLGLFTTT